MQRILKKLKMLLPKASKYGWWDEYQLVNSQPMLNFPDELETYNKVIKVIKSCENGLQLKTSNKTLK